MTKHPDPVTNSEAEDLCIYEVPQAWIDDMQSRSDDLQISGDKAATKKDVDNFNSLGDVSMVAPTIAPKVAKPVATTATGSTPAEPTLPGVPVVKQEPLTPSELSAKKVSEFRANPGGMYDTLQQHHAMVLQIKGAVVLRPSDPISKSVSEQCTKLVGKLTKMASAVEVVIADPTAQEDKDLKLMVGRFEKLDAEIKSLRSWAAPPAKKRKTRA